jgi:arylsulfatase A-like enzyme
MVASISPTSWFGKPRSSWNDTARSRSSSITRSTRRILLPTLAELTGVKPPDVHLDGRSLAGVLRDADAPSPHAGRALHWQVGQGPNADWAVREGDWKLIGNARDTSRRGGQTERIPLFLANVRDDPGETTNLADQQPDLVARLRQLHEQHLK